MKDSFEPRLWFVDDRLVPKCISIDQQVPNLAKRECANPALTRAVRLYLDKAAAQALGELRQAIDAGDLDALLLSGQIQAELNRFEAAAAEFGKLAERSPANRVASFNQGLCLAKAGKFGAAIESLQRAAIRHPELAEVWFALGVSLLNEKQAADALACFRQAVKLREEYVPALCGIAAALQMTGSPSEALEIYERLIAAQPQRQELLANALAAAVAADDSERAAWIGAKLLESDPNYPPALRVLADAALDRRQLSEAMQYCERLAGSDPLCFEAWYNLGACRLRTGEHAGALDAFHRALELKPDDGDALEGRARSLTGSAAPAEARRAWEDLLRVRNGDGEAWFRLGLLRYEAGDWGGAVHAFDQCLRRGTGWPAQACTNLGLSQWRKGERQSAMESFRAALAYDPADRTAGAALTALVIETGDAEAALRCHREHAIDDGLITYNLALLCQDQRKLAAAAGLYREVLDRRPDCPEAHLNLGTVLFELGDREQSQKQWKAAIEQDPGLAGQFLAAWEASPAICR